MKQAFADYLVATGRCRKASLDPLRQELACREPMGRLAVLHGLLGIDDVDRILQEQRGAEAYFGEIALRLGMLTPDQLRILLTGQVLRACVELIEDLALAGALEVAEGIRALGEFIDTDRFRSLIQSDVSSAV